MELASTSFMIYLPGRYVVEALEYPALTPRQAWDQIGKGIVNDTNVNVANNLAPLVDWLWVALVVDIAENLLVAVALDSPSYPFPLTPAVQDIVARCFNLDLSGLQLDTHLDTGTVTAINNLTSKIIKPRLEVANQQRPL